MNKKNYVILAGISAAFLFAFHKSKKFFAGHSPLERTIRNIIEKQQLDAETYRMLSALEDSLRSLPRNVAVETAQLYIDGKLPIGNLGLGNFTDQPYRDLRFEQDGSVYLDI